MDREPVAPAPTARTMRVEVTHADLPLHCPTPAMSLWISHPRVFLPIDVSGEERCPYCGTVYVLTDMKELPDRQ